MASRDHAQAIGFALDDDVGRAQQEEVARLWVGMLVAAKVREMKRLASRAKQVEGKVPGMNSTAPQPPE